jgi:hypothetical protein
VFPLDVIGQQFTPAGYFFNLKAEIGPANFLGLLAQPLASAR